jgi:hypothetical protein
MQYLILINLFIFISTFTIGVVLFKKGKRKLAIVFFLPVIISALLGINSLFIKKPFNPKERNIIIFEVSPSTIEDSLKAFEPLMSKIPIDEFGDIRYENRDSVSVTINNTYIDFNKTLTDTNNNIEVLKDFSKQELNRFINLIIFFKKNHLSNCDYDKESNSFMFDYRAYKEIKNSDWQYDLIRHVYFSTNNILYDDDIFKELDKKGNLYLIVSKDAHIW